MGAYMIKNIIFDIGQVLAKFRWKEFIDDLGFEESIQKRVAEATVLSRYWKEVDRGVMSMQDIIDGCVSLDPEIEDKIRLFYKDRRTIVTEFDYSEKLVLALKHAGYNIYLLSNYGEENFSYVKNIFTFMKYIDGSIISYEVKTIKPEPLIYKLFLEKYGLIPDECVFLDDLEDNLNTAKEFGIHTIHFTGLSAGIIGLKQLGIEPAFDGIIFDLDGTLWDSTIEAAKVWTKVSKKHGVNKIITSDELKKLYGLPLEDIARNLFSDIDEETALSIMEESVAAQCPVLAKNGGIIFEDVEKILRKLVEKFPLFIVSNCRSGYIEAFLEYSKFNNYFTDFECPGRTGKLKADNIRIIMERNNLNNPIYVGDTKGDKKAANEAGILFIYAAYGFGSLSNNDIEVQSFNELEKLLY